MNKTISINLSGLLFNIEEVGYEKLSAYLNKIKAYFVSTNSGDEILNDVEGRIAELFQEKLTVGKQVITERDVLDVMDVMGKPEDYAQEMDENEIPNQSSTFSNLEQGDKKLFRDMDNQAIGGVCAGIANYFGIDRVWLRLIFAFAFIFAGSGLLLYIILWIVIPEAKTTADKLRMKGEPVNVENIERRVKEDFRKMGKSIEDAAKDVEHKIRNQKPGDKINSFFAELFSVLGNFLKLIFNVLGKFLGFFLLIIGLTLFFAIIALALGNGVFSSGSSQDLIPIKSIVNALFEAKWQSNLFFYGFLMLLISPVIALLLAGLRLLMFPKMRMKIPASVNASIFTFGIIASIVSVAILMSQFSANGKVIESINIEQPQNDTLYVDINTDQKANLSKRISMGNYEFFFNDEEEFIFGKMHLNILATDAGKFQLKLIKTSRGKNKEDALQFTEHIKTGIAQEGEVLKFNPYFNLKPERKLRGQQIQYELSIPEGKHLKLSANVHRILNDIESADGIRGASAAGHLFLMTEQGLQCLDCESEEI